MSAPRELRFDVFGRRMAVVDDARGRRVFLLGVDGKRRPVDVPVPPDLDEADIATWLGDLFHEAATGRHPEVLRLP